MLAGVHPKKISLSGVSHGNRQGREGKTRSGIEAAIFGVKIDGKNKSPSAGQRIGNGDQGSHFPP
jgi:hypothetical protein